MFFGHQAPPPFSLFSLAEDGPTDDRENEELANRDESGIEPDSRPSGDEHFWAADPKHENQIGRVASIRLEVILRSILK